MIDPGRGSGAGASSRRTSVGGASTILFGGSGFLGSHVLRACPEMISVGRTRPPTAHRHVPIASLDDLRPLDDLDFDAVVFLVGNSDRPGLEREVLPPGAPSAFDYHLTPLLRTLEQLRHRPIRKFVHFSTVVLYDADRLSLPVSEDTPLDPFKTRYTLSKHLAEEACRFYGRWIPILTLRLSNMYGPFPRDRFDVIYLLIRQLLEQGQAQVQSRRPKRDFLHVEDAARAVAALVDTDCTGTLNLGTGEMWSVGTIVDLLQQISGCPIVDRDGPVLPPLDFQCDISALRRCIDFVPQYSIEAGLRQTFDAMKAVIHQNRGSLARDR